MSPSPRRHFLDRAAQGELAFQRDGAGMAFFPPRVIAPKDGAAPVWDVSAGRGVIHALTLARHKGEPPLALAMIEMDEGFRLMSNVLTATPESLRIGDRVEVAFRPLAEGEPPLPVFRPAEARA